MIPFKLPAPEGYSSGPTWNGEYFMLDGMRHDILEYSENFAGWSDDLTALHEEAVGESHPIDIASRNDALSQAKLSEPDSNTVIMEIGCSSGFLIRELVAEFPNSVIIGADVVKEPLARLHKALPNIPLMRFDLLKCPIPKNSVDILLMLNVLEHIENDVLALQKAFDLLKPGGKLIIEVPAGPTLYDDYDRQLHHFRRYTSAELRGKVEKAGFKVGRLSHLGALLFPAFASVKYLNKLFPKKNKQILFF